MIQLSTIILASGFISHGIGFVLALLNMTKYFNITGFWIFSFIIAGMIMASIAVFIHFRCKPLKRFLICGAWSKFETKCIRKKGHKGLHSDEKRDFNR